MKKRIIGGSILIVVATVYIILGIVKSTTFGELIQDDTFTEFYIKNVDNYSRVIITDERLIKEIIEESSDMKLKKLIVLLPT
jgi:hypothetical protein